MRRREVIALAGGAVAWPVMAAGIWRPLAANAERLFRIGFLGVGLDAPGSAALYAEFLDELRIQGFREGQNLTVEYRRSDDPRGTLVAGAELAQLPLDVIVAQGPELVLQALSGANRDIPIVLQAINYDAVARGYVASLARPGGNLTGLFYRQAELAAKKVELLAQAFPERTHLAVLYDALVEDERGAAEKAAETLRLDVHGFKLDRQPYDFDAAFRDIARSGAQMLLVMSSPLFAQHRRRVAALALEHWLPSMFIFKSYVDVGGLMSYGVDQGWMNRRTADFVAKILNGAKPADLPVEQPTKFELVINLKTAKALGLAIPPTLLARADEVLE